MHVDKIKVEQNTKCLHHTTIKNNLPHQKIIFHYNGIQPHHSAVISTIYMHVEDFVVEIHHGDILYFPTQLVNSKNS